MSRLEDLITNLCPNGVLFRRLDECCTLEKGKTPIQKAVPGEYPLVVTTSERKSAKNYQFEEPTVCIPLVSSRGHGVASLNAVYYQEGKFALGNILCGVTPFKESGLTAKFLYYYLNLKKDQLIVPLMKGGANVSLTVNALKTIRVPIPPVEVQTEIIRLIDKFSELISTLQDELQARKKQYEYYFDRVFNMYNSPKVKLGDIGNVKMCKRILKSQTSSSGDVPFYKIGTFGKEPDAYISLELYNEYVKKYSYPSKGDILISCSGTIGRAVVFDGKPAYFQDSNIVWLEHDGTKVTNDFLRYAYMTKPWSISTGGTISRLYNDGILKAEIPLPTIEQQNSIVSILNRFDTLCNDIFSGLPAEIEARQKQYEYYRDKLLAFKPLS